MKERNGKQCSLTFITLFSHPLQRVLTASNEKGSYKADTTKVHACNESALCKQGCVVYTASP
jgi:hypothetical protein